MKWPLIGSAACHLALISALLLLRVAAGPAFPVAVQVFLVEGDRSNASPEEPPSPRLSRQSPPPASGLQPPGIPAVIPEVISSYSPPVAIAEPLTIPAGGKVWASAAVPIEPVPGPDRDSGRPVSVYGGGREPSAASVPAEGAKAAPVPFSGTAGTGGAGEGTEIRLLRERIESRIIYPEEAIKRGQEGEVLLRIRVGEGGIPGEIRIARSSGARALDEAARKGVARAAPLPSLPGWFEVPVRFFLR